jgi:hypothetical protein
VTSVTWPGKSIGIWPLWYQRIPSYSPPIGKIFVHPFNCYIHNTSKCRTTRLLIHLCLQASFFVDRTWLHRCGSKHERIRRRRWHRQRRGVVIELCYMWCIYVIKWRLYIVVKTIWIIVVIYVLNLNCQCSAVCAIFWSLPMWGGNQNMGYIYKYIYSLVNRRTYDIMFLS